MSDVRQPKHTGAHANRTNPSADLQKHHVPLRFRVVGAIIVGVAVIIAAAAIVTHVSDVDAEQGSYNAGYHYGWNHQASSEGIWDYASSNAACQYADIYGAASSVSDEGRWVTGCIAGANAELKQSVNSIIQQGW